MRTADTPHRIRAAILFVIGVQDVKHSQRSFKHRVRLVLQFGGLEHHVEEVAFVTQIVIGVRILHTDPVTKRERRNRRNFRDQSIDLFPATLDIENLFRVRIKSRQRAESGFEHAHRVRVVVKTVDHLLDTFVDESVVGDVSGPFGKLCGCRELAVKQQVSDFEIRALLSELIDGIAAVFEDPLVAIDKGDAALAGSSIHERRIVSHQSEIVVRDFDLAQIHRLYCAVLDWELILFSGAIIDDGKGVFTHASSLTEKQKQSTGALLLLTAPAHLLLRSLCCYGFLRAALMSRSACFFASFASSLLKPRSCNVWPRLLPEASPLRIASRVIFGKRALRFWPRRVAATKLPNVRFGL